MNFIDYKEQLKEKLWLLIDQLSDEEGFVLTATAEEISMVKLRAAGYDENLLEIEPVQLAEYRTWHASAMKERKDLINEIASFNTKLSNRKKQLRQIEAAIAKATGEEHPYDQ